MVDDLRCQWCKKVVAVADARGELLPIVPFITEFGKHYHVEPCYRQLQAMRKYVGERES